jgi:hypothetical protein
MKRQEADLIRSMEERIKNIQDEARKTEIDLQKQLEKLKHK